MSKRVTLSGRECEYIVKALLSLQTETSLNYPVIKTGQQVYQDIIDKLSPQDDGFELQPEGTVTSKTVK